MLRDKSIVVIGGTTGIGLSAAKAFVGQGARVVCVGRNADSCRAAGAALGPDALVMEGDAVEPDTAVRAIDACMEGFGGFHGLYHVAGGSGRRYGDGPLHDLTLEGWNRTLELNLTSMMLSCQAAVRRFLQAGRGGSILHLGSVLGMSPSPGHFATHAYAAAKAAAIGLTRAAAAHYAADDIRINLLAPALVETPMAKRAAADPAILHFIGTKQPLDGGRIGRPEDLDAAAVYFLSDASRFTTGQVLHVDGGWDLSEGQYQ